MALLIAMARGRTWRVAGRFWIVCCLALWTSRAPAAEPAPSAEYQIKAVFLFNFAQFVEWPARAFADARAPLVIGILGDDPYGAYLDDLVKGEKIGERPLVVRRYRDLAEVAGCHVLFVSRSESDRFPRILSSLKGQSVLTVSDADTFSREGGMIRFVADNGKIRLGINVEAAKACGLIISSKIIRPATIVTAGKD